MRQRILIIEDNPRVSRAIKRRFDAEGFSTAIAESCRDGNLLARRPFDLITLDVMLPDGDGIELCIRLRRSGIETPIIMVTALGNEAIAGFNAGADGFITKPFEFGELLARIRAILRRRKWNSTPPFR